MKFAEIGYIKDGGKLWVKNYILKLPKAIKEKYFFCLVPLKVEEIKLADERGYRITLPITKNEENIKLKERMIKKTIAFLMDKNIEIIINNDYIPMPVMFLQARGSILLSYFVYEEIKSYCNKKKLDLGKLKILVKDGKNLETFIVLSKLFGEVNQLSICTDNEGEFSSFCNSVYEETGLVTEFFSNPKSGYMKEADIVINCSADMENYDYIFKKDALYIECSSVKGKLKRIMERRQDLNFLYETNKMVGNKSLNSSQLEALVFAKCKDVKKVVTGFKGEKSGGDASKFLDMASLVLKG